MSLTTLFTGIADAIRTKEGSTGTIAASAFPARIAALTGGGGDAITNARTVEVTAAGAIQIGDTVYTVEDSAAPAAQADGEREELPGPVRTAAFSPDGKLLVLGGPEKTEGGFVAYGTGWAKLYRVGAGGTLSVLKDLTWGEESVPAVVKAAWSPDGTLLALTGTKGENYNSMMGAARVYTVAGSAVTEGPELYADAAGMAFPRVDAADVVFSPIGDALFLLFNRYGSAGQETELYAYSVAEGQVSFAAVYDTAALKVGSYNVPSTMALKPDGTRLLAGWRLFAVAGTTLTKVKDLSTATSPSVMAFSPDGTLLAAADYNGAKVYAVEGDAISAGAAVELGGTCNDLAFSPDGGALAVAGGTQNYSQPQSSSGFVKMFNLGDGTVTPAGTLYEVAREGDMNAPRLFSLAFAPDGETLVAGGGAIVMEGSGGSAEGLPLTSEIGGVYVKGADGWVRKDGLYGSGGGETPAVVTAYPAPEGVIPVSAAPCGVGYAKSAMAEGETGTVVVIGRME